MADKTRNKLSDLNDHLFAELERLGDEDMNEEELNKELKRAVGISKIAKNVIMNANTMLSALKFAEKQQDEVENEKASRLLFE